MLCGVGHFHHCLPPASSSLALVLGLSIANGGYHDEELDTSLSLETNALAEDLPKPHGMLGRVAVDVAPTARGTPVRRLFCEQRAAVYTASSSHCNPAKLLALSIGRKPSRKMQWNTMYTAYFLLSNRNFETDTSLHFD